MGLLDNQFMKLVLSGSPYMQARENQRRQDELAGRVQGLIGQPGMAGADDGLGLSMQPGQIGTPGTGLLGGQMTQPQFAAQLMGIPGYQTHGTSMMNNQFSNQSAMQRQQQGQDFSLNNMTAYQQAQVEQAKQGNIIQQGVNAFKQNLEGLKMGLQQAGKRTERIDAIGDDVTNVAKAYAPAIAAGRNLDNTLEKVGGDYSKLNGLDALEIQSQFLTAIRPNEAQMEGDLRQLADAMGFKGKMDEMWNFISSNTPKKPEHLAMMGNIIRKQAQQGQEQVTSMLNKAQSAMDLDAKELAQVSYRVPDAYTPTERKPIPPGLVFK